MADFDTTGLKRNPAFNTSGLKRNPITPRVDIAEPEPFNYDGVVEGYNFSYRDPGDPTIKEDVSRATYHLAKPFLGLGYTAASAFNRGMSTFSTHLDLLGDYINEKSGAKFDFLKFII